MTMEVAHRHIPFLSSPEPTQHGSIGDETFRNQQGESTGSMSGPEDFTDYAIGYVTGEQTGEQPPPSLAIRYRSDSANDLEASVMPRDDEPTGLTQFSESYLARPDSPDEENTPTQRDYSLQQIPDHETEDDEEEKSRVIDDTFASTPGNTIPIPAYVDLTQLEEQELNQSTQLPLADGEDEAPVSKAIPEMHVVSRSTENLTRQQSQESTRKRKSTNTESTEPRPQQEQRPINRSDAEVQCAIPKEQRPSKSTPAKLLTQMAVLQKQMTALQKQLTDRDALTADLRKQLEVSQGHASRLKTVAKTQKEKILEMTYEHGKIDAVLEQTKAQLKDQEDNWQAKYDEIVKEMVNKSSILESEHTDRDDVAVLRAQMDAQLKKQEDDWQARYAKVLEEKNEHATLIHKEHAEVIAKISAEGDLRAKNRENRWRAKYAKIRMQCDENEEVLQSEHIQNLETLQAEHEEHLAKVTTAKITELEEKEKHWQAKYAEVVKSSEVNSIKIESELKKRDDYWQDKLTQMLSKNLEESKKETEVANTNSERVNKLIHEMSTHLREREEDFVKLKTKMKKREDYWQVKYDEKVKETEEMEQKLSRNGRRDTSYANVRLSLDTETAREAKHRDSANPLYKGFKEPTMTGGTKDRTNCHKVLCDTCKASVDSILSMAEDFEGTWKKHVAKHPEMEETENERRMFEKEYPSRITLSTLDNLNDGRRSQSKSHRIVSEKKERSISDADLVRRERHYRHQVVDLKEQIRVLQVKCDELVKDKAQKSTHDADQTQLLDEVTKWNNAYKDLRTKFDKLTRENETKKIVPEYSPARDRDAFNELREAYITLSKEKTELLRKHAALEAEHKEVAELKDSMGHQLMVEWGRAEFGDTVKTHGGQLYRYRYGRPGKEGSKVIRIPVGGEKDGSKIVDVRTVEATRKSVGAGVRKVHADDTATATSVVDVTATVTETMRKHAERKLQVNDTASAVLDFMATETTRKSAGGARKVHVDETATSVIDLTAAMDVTTTETSRRKASGRRVDVDDATTTTGMPATAPKAGKAAETTTTRKTAEETYGDAGRRLMVDENGRISGLPLPEGWHMYLGSSRR